MICDLKNRCKMAAVFGKKRLGTVRRIDYTKESKMGGSQQPGPTTPPVGKYPIPARTPGPTGVNDHADPNVTTRLGDTPGPVGVKDHADPTLPPLRAHNPSPVSQTGGGTPVAVGLDHNPSKPGTYLWLQEKGESQGKWIQIESLRWTDSRPVVSAPPTGGAGVERKLPANREMNFSALLDSDTAGLIHLEKTGKFLSGRLVEVGPDGIFFEMEFSGALITHLHVSSGSGALEPTIDFTLNFETWKIRYPRSDDQLGAPDSPAYDLGTP